MIVTARRSWREDLLAAARVLAAAAGAGFVTGLVVGGIGGRLAMLVLRLTSASTLHGMETDDGFTIGIVSGATVFLLGLTAVFGMLGGVLYAIVRTWLPPRARPWIVGALAGVVGGTMVIRPGGLDFTLLDPLPLAIAMFIVLPAGYGVALSALTEWVLSRPDAFTGPVARTGALALSVLLLLLLGVRAVGPFGIVLLGLILAAVFLARSNIDLRTVLTSAPVVWIGRAALATAGVLAAVDLVGDIVEIL